jgi:hypothetical protein
MMALYIVVRHRKNVHPRWENEWTDDDRILSITTTPQVAEQCRDADVVYVHRCGWQPEGGEYVSPVIACSARVAHITGSEAAPRIVFRDVKPLGLPVKRRLRGPTNSYFDDEP